jgi:hypothetical protein
MEPVTRDLHLKIPADLLVDIQYEANTRGLTVSSYVRMILKREVGRSHRRKENHYDARNQLRVDTDESFSHIEETLEY